MGRVSGRRLWLLAVLACLLWACSAGTTPVVLTPAPSSSVRAFTFASSGDAAALDPWNVVDDNSLQVTQQIFETLVSYDTQSFDIKPGLAVSWSVSADKRQWTFKLRDGVKFHDGTDFNSDAVVFNFDRARLTKFKYRNAQPVADDYNYYQSMWGGFDDDSLITKVEAFDRLTVRFITKQPYGPFLATLAMTTFGIVSPASITADPNGWMLPSSQSAAGTGPFMYTPGAWRKDDQILLVRNPNYWQFDDKGVRLPYVERVLLRSIPDTGDRLAALRSGQIHAMRDFAPGDLPILKAEPRITLLDRAPNNIGYVRFNTHAAPLDNPDVRKAIAMAIDPQAFAQVVFGGFAAPATQFLPPGMLGYDDGTRAFQAYDPSGAARILDLAGIKDLQIELWYMPIARPYFPEPRKAAESIQASLKKIGITVLLNTTDFTSYRDQFKRNQYQMWLYGWTGDNGDPDNFLCVFFCNMTQNGSWDDVTAQRAIRYIKDAQSETDQLRRADLYRQASREIQRGVPAVPIVHADVPVAVLRTVSGYVPHPKGCEVFTYVQLGR